MPNSTNNGVLGKRKSIKDVIIKDVKSSRKPANYFRVELLRGNIEVYWCELDEHNDSFLHHLHKAIETDPTWRSYGFLCTLWRRISVQDDNYLRNERDPYPRKVIVRVPPDNDESTHEKRLHNLTLLRNFCIHPTNNKFNHAYIVDESSDLTASHHDNLSFPDVYLQNAAICQLIEALYEDAGTNWYHNNKELARNFWTGPRYPIIARNNLGYPISTFDDEEDDNLN